MPKKNRMRIAILVMQRDERLLLPVFLRYHESMLGSSSIYLFDNGSSDPHVIKAVKAAEARGVHVRWDHNQPNSFVDKGNIFTDLIHELDANNPFDFYFPLDCDEFLACDTPVGPSCSWADIEQTLTPLVDNPAALFISHKYWANPLLKNHYQLNKSSRKCFFANGACGSMDHGFHHGRSRTDAGELSTPIIYYEFHYKPYWAHQQACKNKLLAFHSNHSRRELRSYVARQWYNYHCAYDLLQSKFAYLSQFTRVNFPLIDQGLLITFSQLGADVRALFEPVPPKGKRLWLRWLAIRAQLNTLWLNLRESLEAVVLALPHCWRGLCRRLRSGD